jgi:hypothetical protein
VLAALEERQRRMAPFGGGAIFAGQHTPVDDDAAADARPQGRAEHDVGPRAIHVERRRRCAIDRLRQHETLAVVRQPHRASERRG